MATSDNEALIVKKLFDLEKKLNSGSTQDMTYNIGTAFSMFTAIHGLTGFWPMSTIDGTLVYDKSSQGRSLTKAGAPTAYELPSGVSYYDFNGSTQYLYRADEAALDVAGVMTMGGWFHYDTAAAATYCMSKYRASTNQRAYGLGLTTGIYYHCVVSVDGTAVVTCTSNPDVAVAGTWVFQVMRYTPSTELALFVNGKKYVNTTSIPASIFNSSESFMVGAGNGGTTLMDGKATFCFLAIKAIQDADIRRLFNNSRTLFGV